MARDYRKTVRALRAKAADPAVPASERIALLERAAEMEERHGLKDDRVKPFPDSSTITDRSGQTANPYWQAHATPPPPTETPAQRAKRYADAWSQTQDLFNRQTAWNPPPVFDDEHEDEDYGYEYFNDYSAYHQGD